LAEAAREDAATQAVRDVGVEIAKAMNQRNEIFASLVTLLAARNNKHAADVSSSGTQ
jgi:hypothetical protein